jgi:hypothetical protein
VSMDEKQALAFSLHSSSIQPVVWPHERVTLHIWRLHVL